MLYILLCIVALCIVATQSHSGFYSANAAKRKDESDSFLISKERFIATEMDIRTGNEVVISVIRPLKVKNDNYFSLMSRDYLDFMVEQWSTAVYVIPSGEQLSNSIQKRMEKTAKLLKKYVAKSVVHDHRLDRTLAVVSFEQDSKVSVKIQVAMMDASIWSVVRYFKNVIVLVTTREDQRFVEAIKLPILQTVLKSSIKDGLLYVLEEMKQNEGPFSRFKYVYYSKGDQILHMRESQVLYDTLDGSEGSVAFIPHRMQALSIAQDYPMIESKWNNESPYNIPNITIVVEDIREAVGSCCGNGDVVFTDCQRSPWYQCWNAAKQFQTWLKFGEFGMSMPPVTEHLSTCFYSQQRQRCPLPSQCSERFPFKGKTEVCSDLVNSVSLCSGGADCKSSVMKSTSDVLIHHKYNYYVVSVVNRAIKNRHMSPSNTDSSSSASSGVVVAVMGEEGGKKRRKIGKNRVTVRKL